MKEKVKIFTSEKMDVGKADTLKHGHRPEKLFMDMYMLQPIRKVKQKTQSGYYPR